MLVPVPAIDPGLMVQVPVEGRPLNTTLPVGTAHEEGWIIVPNTGVVVGPPGVLMITSVDASEVHPDAIVTVKLYVPGIRSGIVVLVPVPVIAPGLIVQVPVAGSPLKSTLPVGAAHEEGCVIVPIIGAGGASGAGFITTFAVAREEHLPSLVIVKL